MAAPGHRLRRLLGAAATIFALAILLGFFAVPPIVERTVENQLSAALDRPVSIERMRFNPFTATLAVEDFSVGGKDAANLAAFSRLHINVDATRSLWRLAPVVSEVRLEGLRINLVREAPGRYNFSDLLERGGTRADGTPGAKPLPKFSISNLQFADAAIALEDRVLDRQHSATALRITLPFVSTLPSDIAVFVEPAVEGRINGAPFTLAVRSQPFAEGRGTRVELDVESVDLAAYQPYWPPQLPVELKSGTASARLELVFERRAGETDRLQLAGTVELGNLAVLAGKTPLASADRVSVDIEAIEPLARRLHLREIAGAKVRLNVQRRRDGRLALTELFRAGNDRAAENSGNARGLRVQIDRVTLNGEHVEFRDQSLERPFVKTLAPFSLEVAGIDTGERRPIITRFSGIASTGERFELEGEIRRSPLQLTGALRVRDLPAASYEPYYAPYVSFDTQSGRLDAQARYALTLGKTLRGTLDIERIDLRNASLRPRGGGEAFMDVERARLAGPKIDFEARRVRFDSIEAEKGHVLVELDGERRVNLARYFTPPREADARAKAPGKDRPWQVDFGRLQGSGAIVTFVDASGAEPARFVITAVAVSASDLTTASGKRGTVSVQIEGHGGSGKISGAMALRPFATTLDLNVRDVALAPGLPYLRRYLNVGLEGGRASFDGQLSVQTEPFGAPGIIRGDILVTDAVAKHAKTGETFARWASLHLGNAAFGWLPTTVDIGQVALRDFYSRIEVSPEGKLNLQALTVAREAHSADAGGGAPEAGPEAAGDTSARPRIGRITLQGGEIDFADHFITPNFSAGLVDIGGSLAGLDGQPGETAELDLRGSLRSGAPTRISGTLSPIGAPLALDLVGQVRGIELTPFSPYSKKYLGYGIDGGTLSFEARYQVADGKLDASNQIVLNQLRFGDRVESPQATKLPVLFALRLLRDSNGVIDVNVPVSGTLDDPEFSVAGVVGKVVFNMISRAVTSPFRMLGNLVGRGEQLRSVRFDAGEQALDATARDTLDALAEALRKRPGINLEIVGHAARDDDAPALRRAELQRRVADARQAAQRDSGAGDEHPP